jgi:predicted aspartyl protease
MAQMCGCGAVVLIALAALCAGGQAPRAPGDEQRLHVTADETSEVLAILGTSDTYTPIAETSAPDGTQWYLVRTKNNVAGWLKVSSREQANKIASQFAPLAPQSVIPAPEAVAASLPRGRFRVAVEISGSLAIVPVTLNRTLNVNLAVDTGATTTLLSRRIASRLGLTTLGSRVMVGIGGAVRSPMAKVDSVKVGAAEVFGLIVVIHDLPQLDRFDGLLGLDYLKHFEIALDPGKRQLWLDPR